MKALVIWGSYGASAKVCEVEKETDTKELERWNQPERFYKIKNTYLDCEKREIDYESVLGNEHNYIIDSVGFTHLHESYVCPINDLQAEAIIKTFKSWEELQKEKLNTLAKEACEHKEAVHKKAIETGEPQVLSKRMENCNDPKEECNVDIITVYAMPDGSTKTVRQHTW